MFLTVAVGVEQLQIVQLIATAVRTLDPMVEVPLLFREE
jgi:hypothetical protein